MLAPRKSASAAPFDPEAVAAALEASPDFRILRRLKHREGYSTGAAGREVTAAFVDCETEGLGIEDKIVEIGIISFVYDADTGKVLRLTAPVGGYSAFEDRGRPLTPEISRLTGIEDADLAGQHFDDAAVEALMADVQLVIAHNAGFDRPRFEKRFPFFASKPWDCSFKDVDWPVSVFPHREGHVMSRQRAYRLWSLAELKLPRRPPHKRVATSRPRPLPAYAPNQVWAYDFVFDACANGQQLKCLTLIDEFTRESLAIDVGGSIRSKRVIEVLAKLISVRGAPTHLRSDNGPKFVSHAILERLTAENINTAHIEPGKPWQNGADESFNGKFCDECLSIKWFRIRAEAMAVIEAWRRHYNHVRP